MEALSLRLHRRAQLLAGVGVAFRLQLRPWGSGLEMVREHGPEAGGAGARGAVERRDGGKAVEQGEGRRRAAQ